MTTTMGDKKYPVKRRFYESRTVASDTKNIKLAPVPANCVRYVQHDHIRGTTTYTTLLADNTAKERVFRGCATVDDKIEALPTMTPEDIHSVGLSWAFVDGNFTPGAERLLRELDEFPLNAIRARRGTRYIFDMVRSITGAASLVNGTQEEHDLYDALLHVTLASAEIEKVHDPEAVHLTPEIAAVVAAHMQHKDDIIRYIRERQTTIRDIDPQYLREYITDIPRSVSEGFL